MGIASDKGPAGNAMGGIGDRGPGEGIGSPSRGGPGGGPRGGDGARNRSTETRTTFEGPTESPETIAARTFLQRQRAGFTNFAPELRARRPRRQLLTSTLGTSPSTILTRRTLG